MELTTALYRLTGPEEIELVKDSGFTQWAPRLPQQPIFYPVTNEEYAVQIARDWNARDGGLGFVTRFKVKEKFFRGSLTKCTICPWKIDINLITLL